MTVFWIVVAVIAVAVVMGAIALSGLMRRRKRLDAAWVAIDSELRHRHELVSSLLNTVLAIAPTKDDSLASLTRARRDALIAGTSGDPARISSAENAMNSSLTSGPV